MLNFKINKHEIYLIQVTYTLFEFVYSVTPFVSTTSNFVIPLFNMKLLCHFHLITGVVLYKINNVVSVIHYFGIFW